jgi:hypothetical protein
MIFVRRSILKKAKYDMNELEMKKYCKKNTKNVLFAISKDDSFIKYENGL